jgi:hypothetical protein
VPVIEAVVVCVDYSDFLAWTLPANRSQFNRMVVVTTPDDTATQAVCERYEVECVKTDAFHANGDVFAKGRGINAGLERLSLRGWVLHMDADIYLPPKTRGILDRLPLDPQKLYGCDRLMCPDAQAFARYLDAPPPIQSDWVFVRAEAFPVGVRIAQYMERGGGYVPIGYWQLWNPSGSGVSRYPETHGTAARTDFQHGTSWPRERRELLAEIIVIHLESAPGMALNWEGRRTPPFQLGATPEPVAPVPSRRPRFPIRYRQPWALRLLLEVLREWLLVLGRLFSRLRGRET